MESSLCQTSSSTVICVCVRNYDATSFGATTRSSIRLVRRWIWSRRLDCLAMRTDGNPLRLSKVYLDEEAPQTRLRFDLYTVSVGVREPADR